VKWAMTTTRALKREDTRNRIVEAAARIFAERGFRAASTRDIAKRARVTQGLVVYHFSTKAALWKAAIDHIFTRLRDGFTLPADGATNGREQARALIRHYVRFVAAHPELFRLMVEEGKHADARTRWLVDTHLRPLYAGVAELVRRFAPGLGEAAIPHAYYAIAGAGSLIFAVAPECRRLTGLDPTDAEAVDAHADFIARLLVP